MSHYERMVLMGTAGAVVAAALTYAGDVAAIGFVLGMLASGAMRWVTS